MARKKKSEEEPSGIDGFKFLFPEIVTVLLETSVGDLPIIAMNEMPMSTMAQFVEAPDGEKITMMTKLMEVCLVNPSDSTKLMDVSVNEFQQLIAQWMQKSSDVDD